MKVLIAFIILLSVPIIYSARFRNRRHRKSPIHKDDDNRGVAKRQSGSFRRRLISDIDDHYEGPIGNIHQAPNWSGIDHYKYRPSEYKLVKHLLRYYDKRIRPVQSTAGALNITFGLALAQIIDVDEKNQQITTNCWLNTAWIDFQLTWNPFEWGGIKILRLPYELIWLPDIVLYNNADMMTSFSTVSTNVIVQHTGNVTWLTMTIYRSTCGIDVKFFPFDTQKCSLNFSSWTYDGIQMGIEVLGSEGDVSNYIENTEWSLLNFSMLAEIKYFSCCPDHPYPFISYTVLIKRRPLYYLFNLFVPCILLTIIGLLGFYVPADCGEKVSMGITTLLSMTVFLMVVAESLPPTKQHVPLLGLYFGFTIVVISCATGLTVLSLNIHFQGKRGIRMPRFMRLIFFRIVAKILCYNVYLPFQDALTQPGIPHKPPCHASVCTLASSDVSDESLDTLADNLQPHKGEYISCGGNISDLTLKENLLKSIDRLIQNQDIRVHNKRVRMAIAAEWQQASIIVDRLFIVGFFGLTAVITLEFYVSSPDGSYPLRSFGFH